MKSPTSERWTLQHLEVLLLAGTLLATVIISLATLHQTTHNFQIERTSAFVARFNSQELVALREDVDRWLERGENPAHLYFRSDSRRTDPASSPQQIRNEADDALRTIAKLRTLANYFQEFGTALKIGSLDDTYAHALLGALCIRYGKALEPFIIETRIQRKRPQAFAEVFALCARMEAIDKIAD
jgi:hypothetical protein